MGNRVALRGTVRPAASFAIHPLSVPNGYSQLQRALAILRRPGIESHVYMSGAAGATLNGLQTGNYTLSDGSTGYSAVDGPAGLVLDGMGTVGSELAPATTSTAGWSVSGTGATLSSDGTSLIVTNGAAFEASLIFPTVPAGNTYLVTANITVQVGSSGNFLVPPSGGTPSNIPRVGVGILTGFITSGSGGTARIAVGSGTIGHSFTVSNISFKQVPGIHATQPTTANKPTERRGLYNLLTYGNDTNNAAWTKTNCTIATGIADPFGGTTAQRHTITAQFGSAVSFPMTVVNGQAYTYAAWVRLVSGNSSISLTQSSGTTTASSFTATSTWALQVFNFSAGATSMNVQVQDRNASGQPTVIDVGPQGLFTGTLTAQQILDSGGIPLTTAAAASNPAAGRYSWQFDGGDSLALGSVPFQQADDHAVIAACSYRSPVDTGTVFSNEGATNTPLAALLQLSTSTNTVSCFWRDDAGTLVQQDITYTLGEVCVASARKVGNQRQARKNGVLGGSSTNVLGATTLTASGIGSWRGDNSLNGNISIVIVVKGTLSDADMLVLERFAASLTPNAPSF